MRRWLVAGWVVGASVALAGPARADEAACTPPDARGRGAAKASFARGLAAFREAGYADAIAAWREAYRLDCTAHALLLDLARALELDGSPLDAADALESYLARSPGDRDAEVLRKRIATLRARGAPAALASGSAAPTPEPADAPRPSPTVAAPADERPRAPAAPADAPAAPRARPGPLPWILIGTGATAALAGGVMFVAGRAKVASADAACPSREDCEPDDADRGNAGAHLRDAGLVVAGGGTAVLATGLVWHLLAAGTDAGSRARASLAPELGAAFAGVRLDATF